MKLYDTNNKKTNAEKNHSLVLYKTTVAMHW